MPKKSQSYYLTSSKLATTKKMSLFILSIYDDVEQRNPIPSQQEFTSNGRNFVRIKMAKLNTGEDGNTTQPNNFTPWHIPKALKHWS